MSKYQYWKGTSDLKMTGNNIFTYGSNPEGRHGMGAALLAMEFGATYGKGRGLSGNTYALVTKNLTVGYIEKSTGITYNTKGFRSVTPAMVSVNIDELYRYALDSPELIFYIAYRYSCWPNGRVKASLNGYDSLEMWELFTKDKVVPPNIRFHESFKHLE